MGITYGDHLIDSGYHDITPEQEREIEARSDVVLVNYDKPSVGTSMEVYHAWLKHVPVIVVCREGMVISPWLRYHSTKIVHSFDEASLWIANL